MSERIDAETLAAFLEGKLEPGERARVLRILAEHPEEYEAFADAAHAATALGGAAELKGNDTTTPSVAIGTWRRRRWVLAVPAAMAAGITVIALIQRPDRNDEVLPMALAQRLSLVSVPGPGSLEARLGRNWDQTGWSVTRGGQNSAATPVLAFRLGARATDVELSIATGDTLALGLVGTDLLDVLSRIEGGAGLSAQYRAILSGGQSQDESARRALLTSLRTLLGQPVWFDLGAWAEAARVATMADDGGFLLQEAAYLDDLSTRVEKTGEPNSPVVAELLRELRTVIEQRVPAEPDRIRNVLGRLMATAGR